MKRFIATLLCLSIASSIVSFLLVPHHWSEITEWAKVSFDSKSPLNPYTTSKVFSHQHRMYQLYFCSLNETVWLLDHERKQSAYIHRRYRVRPFPPLYFLLRSLTRAGVLPVELFCPAPAQKHTQWFYLTPPSPKLWQERQSKITSNLWNRSQAQPIFNAKEFEQNTQLLLQRNDWLESRSLSSYLHHFEAAPSEKVDNRLYYHLPFSEMPKDYQGIVIFSQSEGLLQMYLYYQSGCSYILSSFYLGHLKKNTRLMPLLISKDEIDKMNLPGCRISTMSFELTTDKNQPVPQMSFAFIL